MLRRAVVALIVAWGGLTALEATAELAVPRLLYHYKTERSMFFAVPSSTTETVTTPVGVKSISHIFFQPRGTLLFRSEVNKYATITIQIDGKTVCNHLMILPFCTSTPDPACTFDWRKVALEVNLNVDLSEVKLSTPAQSLGYSSNDFSVVFVCSDEPCDATKGYDYFECKQFNLKYEIDYERLEAVIAGERKGQMSSLSETDKMREAWEADREVVKAFQLSAATATAKALVRLADGVVKDAWDNDSSRRSTWERYFDFGSSVDEVTSWRDLLAIEGSQAVEIAYSGNSRPDVESVGWVFDKLKEAEVETDDSGNATDNLKAPVGSITTKTALVAAIDEWQTTTEAARSEFESLYDCSDTYIYQNIDSTDGTSLAATEIGTPYDQQTASHNCYPANYVYNNQVLTELAYDKMYYELSSELMSKWEGVKAVASLHEQELMESARKGETAYYWLAVFKAWREWMSHYGEPDVSADMPDNVLQCLTDTVSQIKNTSDIAKGLSELLGGVNQAVIQQSIATIAASERRIKAAQTTMDDIAAQFGPDQTAWGDTQKQEYATAETNKTAAEADKTTAETSLSASKSAIANMSPHEPQNVERYTDYALASCKKRWEIDGTEQAPDFGKLPDGTTYRTTDGQKVGLVVLDGSYSKDIQNFSYDGSSPTDLPSVTMDGQGRIMVDGQRLRSWSKANGLEAAILSANSATTLWGAERQIQCDKAPHFLFVYNLVRPAGSGFLVGKCENFRITIGNTAQEVLPEGTSTAILTATNEVPMRDALWTIDAGAGIERNFSVTFDCGLDTVARWKEGVELVPQQWTLALFVGYKKVI